MNERFCVVFNGEYAEGNDPMDVIARLEQAFDMPKLRVLSLIGRPPAIIRHGLDMMAATQEMQVLAGLGLLTEIVPEDNIEEPWDGQERRLGERRASYDRRGGDRPSDERRGRRGRRSTDHL